MARISKVEEENHPELADLIGRIRGARRGRLINVYKLLLHSPALAESWFAHNNAVRWKTGLDGRLRELVIIHIGYLTQAAYILGQHVPTLALQEGLTLDECDALKDWEGSTLFAPRERAVLGYADAMTRNIQVPEAIFAALKPYFDERGIVELTVLIGFYNMHSRVTQALKIDPESQTG
jgi:alkylhydroperoxidase family enzyme